MNLKKDSKAKFIYGNKSMASNDKQNMLFMFWKNSRLKNDAAKKFIDCSLSELE